MLLGLLSFGMLGILHKLADVKKGRPPAINALLAVSSLVMVFGFVLFGTVGGPVVPRVVALVAIPFGISASVAILAFQAGVKHGHIATSWLAINLSAGIPTVASILIYDEPVSTAKALALAMAWVARMQKRWCALVAYSGDSGERVLALPPGRWDEIVPIVRERFRGISRLAFYLVGTDAKHETQVRELLQALRS